MNVSSSIAVLVAMTLLGAVGGAMFKLYSVRRKRIYLLLGAMSYGCGALLNVWLLRFLPYTVVMPANALTFLWTLFLARWWFGETIGLARAAGVCCIGAGVWLLMQA